MKYQKIAVLLMVFCMICLLSACVQEVSNQDYKVDFDGQSYSGQYTGKMENKLPTEDGEFVCGQEGDESYFIYSGGWKEGKLSGEGTLSTNHYTVHFEDVDRIGKYKGSVIDGVAQGEGSFTAKNDEGVEYTYTGEWKDGLFDGQGHQEFDDPMYLIRDGNFSKGEFRPTILEHIQALGTCQKLCPYKLTDENKQFIANNEDVFESHEAEKIEQNKKEWSIPEYKKNPSAFEPGFVTVNGLTVQQISVDDTWGRSENDILAYTSNLDTVYFISYFGETEGIVENSKISITFLPLGYSTYETVNKTNMWAIVGVAVQINQ